MKDINELIDKYIGEAKEKSPAEKQRKKGAGLIAGGAAFALTTPGPVGIAGGAGLAAAGIYMVGKSFMKPKNVVKTGTARDKKTGKTYKFVQTKSGAKYLSKT